MEGIGELSPAGLVEFLKDRGCSDVDDESFDLIIKNKVSGKRALKYNATDWTNIGIPYGDAKDIMGSLFDSDKENRNAAAVSSQIPSCSTNAEDHSDASNHIDSSLKFECLRKYFTAEDFSEMPDYEKESYMNAKENYEYGLSIGIKIAKPSFMKETPKPQSHPKRDHSKKIFSVQSGADNMRVLRKRTAANESSQLEEQSKSKRKENMDSDFSLASNSDNSSDTADKASNSKTSQSETQQKPKRKRRKRTKPFEHLSDEDFAERLPKYQVLNILKSKGHKLKDVCSALTKDGIVIGPPRKLMMRTLTNHLFFDDKGNINSVSSDQRSGMAASIVREFPLFADTSDPKKRSWWRIFDPSGPSGFIANCTVSIFRRLNPEDRLRGGGRGTLVEVDSEDEINTPGTSKSDFHDKDAEWMSLAMPNDAKKADIFQGMETSFPIRRLWIQKEAPSVTDILKKYVHLMSYDTEMLEREFNLMFPSKGALFLKNFSRLIKLVKDKGGIESVEGFDDDETKGKKLPRPNLQRYKRKNESVMPTLDRLILTVPLGTNVKDLVDQRRKDANSPVQPYIIALKPAQRITKLFIVADSEMIKLKSQSVVAALDVLFKSYFVFNVQYPLGWTGFWEMVERGLCDINTNKLSSSKKELLAMYKFKF
ncbi:Histone-lysine N-methyltransferase PRDM9 [Frankliniella fusca]|uniref:Histone-lysine N-methyltransferase PRDM9 n=1 Tax=Frankliniella fusca TaxID=407009 RepID=A0AAE1HN66_9NEOP|nr:Histone-lysine N-methyltransferase PRDM9 [Frankliniella fusca]KAK3924429.1 Histone-lysine N-methyltransferase PRDM9 [Frankliniella fusca]